MSEEAATVTVADACTVLLRSSELPAVGLTVTRDECREAVYGMPYSEWKAKHQTPLTAELTAILEKRALKH